MDNSLKEPTITTGQSHEAIRRMVDHDPDRHPLVIGLAAPLGTRLDVVVAQLKESLRHFGYTMSEVKLSKQLDDIANPPWEPLPKRGEPGYYPARMAAGDALRKKTDTNAIMAAIASSEVQRRRRAEGATPTTAYVLSSLKHPDEAELLKHVYGSAFWLLAVVSDPEERREDFAEHLAASGGGFADRRVEADTLLVRDEDDETKSHGQHVAKVFKRADFYLPLRRGFRCDEDVDRFLDGVFGKPFMTPYGLEEGMRHSNIASLRSASAGRQVGAALIPRQGSVYVTGTNEVPRPGGGQYWAGDEPDHRDFQTGFDPNPQWTALMLEELFARMAERNWLHPDLRGETGNQLLTRARQPDATGQSLLEATRADAITEFTRCLHAEQSAIVNAALQGISTRGALLISTTFPCHECAKFIVGAGIRAVVFIEPYPKSLVRQLYRDLIDPRAPMPSNTDVETLGAETAAKVPFVPFVGFAPHRYDTVFRAGQRKQGVRVVEFEKTTACPRGDGWNEAATYTREEQAGVAAQRLLREAFGRPEAERPSEDQQAAKPVRRSRSKSAAAQDASLLDEAESTKLDSKPPIPPLVSGE